MKAFSIKSNKSELVLRFDKSRISTDEILKLAHRLQIEYLAQQSGLDERILPIAEEIDNEWWNKNADDFLKDVKK